ncbi:MAG: peptidase dimerization domain-containing protein [Chloroflexia bacterium]
MTSGYQLEGSKTVLPAYASAKVDFRLVPNQTPEKVVASLRTYLDAQGFEDVEIVYIGGENPAKVDPADPFIQLTIRTAQELYGKPPVVSPMIGGSGPIHPFVEHLRTSIQRGRRIPRRPGTRPTSTFASRTS